MMVGNGTQAKQNKAHREDMTWFKSGKKEYTHCSGLYIIRYDERRRLWLVWNLDGTALLDETNLQVFGPSLTWAKAWFNLHMEQASTDAS